MMEDCVHTEKCLEAWDQRVGALVKAGCHKDCPEYKKKVAKKETNKKMPKHTRKTG